MKRYKDADSLFREHENMPSDFKKFMDEKDTQEIMREQYRMLIKQDKEYRKNTWMLIISIGISLVSLIVFILK